MKISRTWAMPSPDTFSIKPIAEFVQRWLIGCDVTVDPFARNSSLATLTNDLNPDTSAKYHLDAEEFCHVMAREGIKAKCGIFDPPYSSRQISECYKSVGRDVGMAETQNAALYKRVRDALDPLIVAGGVVLSFGWNSAGMGRARGYAIEEILLVAHGGAHNDTICVAERKIAVPSTELLLS